MRAAVRRGAAVVLAAVLVPVGVASAAVQEGSRSDVPGDVGVVPSSTVGLDIVDIRARHDTAGSTSVAVRLAGPPSQNPVGRLVISVGTSDGLDCVPPQVGLTTTTTGTTAEAASIPAPGQVQLIPATRSFDPATNTITLTASGAIPGGGNARCAYAVMREDVPTNPRNYDVTGVATMLDATPPAPTPPAAPTPPTPAEPVPVPTPVAGVKAYKAPKAPPARALSRPGRTVLYGICGVSLCRVDPATRKRAVLRKGTKKVPVTGVSASARGQVVAFSHKGSVFRGVRDGRRPVELGSGSLPEVRADGAAVSWQDFRQVPNGPRCYANPFGGPLTCDYVTGFRYVYDALYRSPGDEKARTLTRADAFAWLRGMALVVESDDGSDATYVCTAGAEGECAAPVAQSATEALSQPAASPDGRWIAVVAAPIPAQGADPATRGSIVLYDARSGVRRKVLTRVRADSTPVFSPDSRQVAFNRDGGVWAVPVTGGRAKLVAPRLKLTAPSWSLAG